MDTASGPRNSRALAVASGMRAIASMKNIIRPAVTTPSVHAGPQVPAGEVPGPGPDEDQQQEAGPDQPQAGHAQGAEQIEHVDRQGQRELNAGH